jgi:hypothetical protein
VSPPPVPGCLAVLVVELWDFFFLSLKRKVKLGLVTHACNPSTWETEAAGWRAVGFEFLSQTPPPKKKLKRKCHCRSGLGFC